MKAIIKIALCMILASPLFGHNPAIASFEFFFRESGTVLRTEFSWSLRNALVDTYPYLAEGDVDQADFLDCVLEYINHNVDVTVGQEDLQMESIYQVPGDHSHSYVFILEGRTAAYSDFPITISNSCLFDQYRRQSNNLKVWRFEDAVTCTTNQRRPTCVFEV